MLNPQQVITHHALTPAGGQQSSMMLLLYSKEWQRNATLISETLGLLQQNEAVLGQEDMAGKAKGNTLDQPPHISRPSENYDQVGVAALPSARSSL